MDLFREVEHTGDLAIVVTGVDLPALYARAGLSLFALLVERETVQAVEGRTVRVEGRDPEDLLHEWLSVLLSAFYADGFVAAEIAVTSVTPMQLDAELRGEYFQRDRHVLLREIKAVTYHALAVRPVPNGWEARITFDV